MSETEPDAVLRATLDVPVECAFTKAGAMNSLPTYEVPPIPTLQGMLYAALGRPSLLLSSSGALDSDVRNQEETFREHVQEECRFGLRILDVGESQTSLRSRQKATKSGKQPPFLTYVAQTETLLGPTFRMYVGGPEDEIVTFTDALRDPERLLYLGRSDDLVDIRNVEVVEPSHVSEPATLDCVTPGPGEEPTLLPVEPDYRDGLSTKPARVETVSLTGGEVDSYYETSDGDRFVFLT